MFFQSVKVSAVFMAVLLCAAAAQSEFIEIANYSFEIPVIDPSVIDPSALSYVPSWIELDVDMDPCCGGRNTGVFRNTEPNSPDGDHILYVDGDQLAFLGCQTGNALLQELTAVYQPGKSYRLTVDICPSMRYPPKTTIPMDTVILGLYDPNSSDPNDLVQTVVFADEIISNELRIFSVYLPTVQPEDSWAGETIGIAIRAAGTAGPGPGPYWDFDNVRLIEYPLVPEFTDDSFVNLDDFFRIASEWLLCTETTADLTGEGCVDMEELILLADFWLNDV